MAAALMDPGTLLSSIHENEKKARDLREAHFSPANAAELHELLHQIRKEYRILIVEFPGFIGEKKDVMGMFWKNCFYKQIEEFRKSIKKLKGQLDVNRFNQKLANHVARLCQEFTAFLNDSSKFILKLMNDLEKKAMELVDMSNKEYEQLTNGVHRCLLFLGDLARYKELYSEQEHKDFTESVRHYERAALLVPSSGNSHNQLAMLATYNEAESTALYHYCRSVMTQSPFSGGFENLARLFALNKTSYDTLHQQISQLNAADGGKYKRGNESLKFKFLLTSFVRLHGLFFAWTIRMHMEYLKTVEGSTQDSIESSTLLVQMNESLTKTILGTKVEVDYQEIQDLILLISEEFDDVLYSVKLTDLHLLRLIAISMFSVHFAELPSVGLFSDSNFSTFLQASSLNHGQVHDDRTSIERQNRTIIQSLALSCIYALITRAAIKLCNQTNSHQQHYGNISTEDQDGKPKKLFMEKVLPMLTIFSEWLGQHPTLLNQPTEVESNGGEVVIPPAVFMEAQPVLSTEFWRSRYCVSRESARFEARARSSMKSALIILKEAWEKDNKSNSMKPSSDATVDNTVLLLREHAELRGYLPTNEKLESYFIQFDPLRKSIIWMNDPRARVLRHQIILDFVTHVFLTEKNESSDFGSSISTVKSSKDFKRNLDIKTDRKGLTDKEKKQKGLNRKGSNNCANDANKELESALEHPPPSENFSNGKGNRALRTLDQDNFPSLPGSRTMENTKSAFWKGLKAGGNEIGEILLPANVPEENPIEEFDSGNHFINHQLYHGSMDLINNPEAEEDFEDIVFRPAFARFPNRTPSPFSNQQRSSNPFLISKDSNLAVQNQSLIDYSKSASPSVNTLLGRENQHDVVANDILTSLGISHNKSFGQLSDIGNASSSSNDLWDKLGVTNAEVPLVNPSKSFTNDWGDVLTTNALNGGSDWGNVYSVDQAQNSSRLFSQEAMVHGPPGITSTPNLSNTAALLPIPNSAAPPGLLPSASGPLNRPPAPPGLELNGDQMPVIGKSPPQLPKGGDFLSYLNATKAQLSWNT